MALRGDRENSGPRRGIWQRLLHGREDTPVGERLRAAVLKDPQPSQESTAEPPKPASVEELQNAERFADDRERFLGLIAAPLAAAIGFFIANYLIDHNPAAYLSNGHPNPAHGSVGTYHALELVLLAVAVAMLASAWYRKRLFLGIAMALYGLGVFNLHYWGFGVPFLLAGAWLLVRAYRAHQAVRDATGSTGGTGGASRPRPNKRYTPPA